MFDLGSIVSSKQLYQPQRFMLYGVQGIGKSLAASTFLAPIVLRTEDGFGAIDVPTFPQVAESYDDVISAINALHGDHDFKSFVIDSIDWLEPLVWQQVCNLHPDNNGIPIANIEKIGYGRGYIEADMFWRELLEGLDSLRHQKGMQIVAIAHSEVKTFTPPDDDAYDRYQPKLHKRAFALWQEWCDQVFFINYERRMINRDKEGTQKRAEGEGLRSVYTQERPAFLAKNRWNIPSKIMIGQDKTWKALHDALKASIGPRYPYPYQQQPQNQGQGQPQNQMQYQNQYQDQYQPQNQNQRQLV